MRRYILLLSVVVSCHSAFAVTIIGIAGGSGSGKTTFAELLKKASPDKVSVVSQDNYYKDTSTLTGASRAAINFDHPDAINFSLLAHHLKELQAGKTITLPHYDKATEKSVAGEKLAPTPVIIVEGILVLAVDELKDLFDYRIFIDTADDNRILRRILRDQQQINRPAEKNIEFYYATVKPMHAQFVAPSKAKANIIVSGDNDFAKPAALVSAFINNCHYTKRH